MAFRSTFNVSLFPSVVIVSHFFSRYFTLIFWITWSRINCHALPCIFCFCQVNISLIDWKQISLLNSECLSILTFEQGIWEWQWFKSWCVIFHHLIYASMFQQQTRLRILLSEHPQLVKLYFDTSNWRHPKFRKQENT